MLAAQLPLVIYAALLKIHVWGRENCLLDVSVFLLSLVRSLGKELGGPNQLPNGWGWPGESGSAREHQAGAEEPEFKPLTASLPAAPIANFLISSWPAKGCSNAPGPGLVSLAQQPAAAKACGTQRRRGSLPELSRRRAPLVHQLLLLPTALPISFPATSGLEMPTVQAVPQRHFSK